MTVLTPGLSTQLTATVMTSTGAPAPSNVTWQSQTPAVASVSPAGVVTGITVGTAIITATASGAIGQTSVTVQPAGTGTRAITACGLISAAGTYVLDTDLQSTGASSCLNISNVANVRLDCRGHAVPGMSLGEVNVARIDNCVVSGALAVSYAASVTIAHAAIEDQLSMLDTSSTEVSDSRINGFILMTAGTGTVFLRNGITDTRNGGAAAGVYLRDGTKNQVLQSNIVGTYDGGHANVGTDDGIVLENETGDTVQDNTISGFFDMGVESVDALANATIADNIFTNIGVGGVGSIYCTTWKDNVVRGNRTSSVPTLVFVGDQPDATNCGGATLSAGAFVNNQFVGNVFRNPIDGTLHRFGPAGPSMSVASGIPNVSGNLLQDNDFASFNGPSLNPLGGFIDGGGNICAAPVPGISNFVCTGGGTSTGAFGIFRRPAP